jgi:hypothetical protein
MNKTRIIVLLTLILQILPCSVVNGGGFTEKRFKYVCVIFEKGVDRIAFKGKMDTERFQILFKDHGLANYSKNVIPKDATVFGVFAISDSNEILIMPLYKWAKRRSDYCACQIKPKGKDSIYSFMTYASQNLFLKTLKSRLDLKYNRVEEFDWDPNSANSIYVSIGRCQRDDLLLFLQINKLHFATKERILVNVKFVNIGNKCVFVPAILPSRSSANPPEIRIRNNKGEFAKDRDEAIIPKGILNDKETVLHPGKAIVIIEADLTNMPSFIHSELTREGLGTTREIESLGLWLSQGDYSISASFGPSPICQTKTEELMFNIKADEH